MVADLVPLAFDKIKQTRNYTEIIFRGFSKKFAIYVEPHVGKILHNHLSDAPRKRPLTHHLISSIFRGLDVRVKHVVLYDLQDTTYFARLFLEQNQAELKHIVEIDARPSDSITLALMHRAPIFCSKKVYDEAIAIVES